MFLNTFLQLSKRAKINNSHALTILYEKLNDEFKNRLAIVRKVKNLNNLILSLCNMNANMKRISKQSQLRIKLNASNVPAIKPLFKLYNLALIKPFTPVGVTVVSSVPRNATKTYPGLINVSNMIRQGLILQEEKDKRNSLGFCHCYGKSRYIAIDYKNPTLLTTKKPAIDTFTGNSIVLVPYKPFPMKEKKMFLG